jgi:hypothetical protein
MQYDDCGGEFIAQKIRDRILSLQPATPTEAQIVTGAIAIAKSQGHDPDEPAPLTTMCTEDNAPVPWWMVFMEESEACLKAVMPATPTRALSADERWCLANNISYNDPTMKATDGDAVAGEAKAAIEALIICAEQVTDDDGSIRPHASAAIAKGRAALRSPDAAATPRQPIGDEEAIGKQAVRLLDAWTETKAAEDQPPYHETMALLGKPNSSGWVWAHEVREERDFDAERERHRELALECIRQSEEECERLRGLLDAAQCAWQPIETVPENHFTVLVYGKYGRLTAFRDVAWQWWPFPAGEPLDYTPTHWMPLPEAPSLPSTEGK